MGLGASWGLKSAHVGLFFALFLIVCRILGHLAFFGRSLFVFLQFCEIFSNFARVLGRVRERLGLLFSMIFRISTKNCNFVKNRVFPRKNQYFEGFEP